MEKVVLNNSNDNPFEGMEYCLSLMHKADKEIEERDLDLAFNECNTLDKKKMFYSLLFSIGDITARQHNIFKGVKKDSGGNANREGFFTIIKWLWNKDNKQFIKFLNAGLFEEYTCFDHLLRCRVKTKGAKVENVFNILELDKYKHAIVKHLYKVIKGNNPFNKMLVAKFLTLPRFTKRSGHNKMLLETKEIMRHKAKLLMLLSNAMGWKYKVTPTIANFKGYREWRKQYNGSLESVLFSTGKINEFDKQTFIDWYDKLPSQARYRVENKVLYSKIKDTDTPKYPKIQPWIAEWEKFKENKQEEQRLLEEKIRQNQASEEDKIKLEKVKKEAKVNVGATNFKELYEQICTNSVDKLKLEAFIANKVNLPYNSLVIIDDSGSMSGRPFNFATFIAAVCLVKNPDDDARNLLGFFNDYSHWHSYIDVKTDNTPNSIIRRNTGVKVAPKPFVDPKLSFYENYQNIDNFCKAVFHSGCTNIDSIVRGLHRECEKDPEILDALKNYPVWTIVSDGFFNNEKTATASMRKFMDDCDRYFGFKPFVVIIEVNNWRSGILDSNNNFDDIENVIHIPSNLSQIEQFLTNFKNIERFDIYTPLLSLYRSNRYEFVRNEVI